MTVRAAALLGLILARLAAASSTPLTGIAVEAPGPTGALRGTLLGPGDTAGTPPGPGVTGASAGRARPHPVILIIPGSGPTDRDGNSPLGIKAASYRLLAEGLAAHGVTTVRIDKRGMFGSAGAAHDANAVTIADYAADVHAWTAVIRRLTSAPCIWLLGHSEGGLVALAAAQVPTDLCGLILVAAPGRPMGEVLRTQLAESPAAAPLLAPGSAAIDALESGKRVDVSALPNPLQRLFRPEVQGFLISAFALDPARLIGGFAKPVLIIQGRRDLQVRPEDAELLHAADPAATLAVLLDVNHVLKTVTTDNKKENLATYADPDLPIAPDVIDAIVSFLP